MHTDRASIQVIVGAAIVADGRVLACARSGPPEMAGKWEFPGGKVDPGESEVDALVRECAEELGIRIAVGPRVGGDILLGHGRAVLKVYLAHLLGETTPHPHEHEELRWLSVDQLDSVAWLPADAPIVAALRPVLVTARPNSPGWCARRPEVQALGASQPDDSRPDGLGR